MVVQAPAVLIPIALLAGVGITTVGPGGVFVTAALYGLTDLDSATVAGTASLTFVATGLVGSAAYVRSGELATGRGREASILLSVTAVVGALLGVRANLSVPDDLFGVLLGAFLAVVGVLVAYREVVGIEPDGDPFATDRRRWLAYGGVGFGVGFLGGMLGVGGPVVAVPLLVSLGVPILEAVAVAQVQSIVIAAFATVGYLAAGAVDPFYALLVGVPQVVGVLIGWQVAHVIDPRTLRLVLSVVLVAVAVLVAT